MAPNMSPAIEVTMSIERLGRTPTASSFIVARKPWPICSSTSGDIDAVPPLSPMRRKSSLGERVAVDIGDVVAEQAAARQLHDRLVVPQRPSPTWTVRRRPRARARRKSSSVMSRVVNCGPRAAKAMVRSWSSKRNECGAPARRRRSSRGACSAGPIRHWRCRSRRRRGCRNPSSRGRPRRHDRACCCCATSRRAW